MLVDDDDMIERYGTGGFADVTVDEVESQSDLASVVEALLADLRRDPERWENPTLDRFLGALAAVATDRVAIESPTWRLMAELLLAATGYE